jgi:hypothetical protein
VIQPFLTVLVLFALQGQATTSSIGGFVVVAGTSTPVPNAHITITGPQSVQIDADDSGHFVVRDLQPGRYRIGAARDGFMPGQYGRRGSPGESGNLELAPGAVRNDIIVGLIAKGSISGRVWDGKGDPVSNARVQVLRYTYQDGRRILVSAGSMNTNERGDYAFLSLAPGPYVISAVPPNSSSQLPVYFPGTTDVINASTIDLPSGLNLNGADLRLIDARPVRVSGQVTNGLTGQPAAGAAISLVPHRGTVSTGSTQRAAVSGNGTFEFNHMAPGSYDIVANAGNNGERIATAVPVDVGSSDIDRINLVLLPQFAVNGKVSLENPPAAGANLNNIRVELRREPFTQELLILIPTIKPDGTFTLSGVTPGDYQLKVNTGSVAYVKAARFGGIDALNPPFHIDTGAGDLEIVVSLNSGALDAVVLDDKQNPIPGATIVLVPEPPRRNRGDLYDAKGTDTTGRAHLTGIAPGDYRVFAWDEIPADAWQDSDFIRPYESRGKLVHVVEGNSATVQLDLISRP